MIASTSFYFALTPEQTSLPMGSLCKLTSMSSFRLPKSKSIKKGLAKLASIPSSLSRSSLSKKSKKDAFDFTSVSSDWTLVEDEQEVQTTFTSTSSEAESTLVDSDQESSVVTTTPFEGDWISSPRSSLTKSQAALQLKEARRRARLSHEQYLDSRQENKCLISKDNFQVDQSLQDTLKTSFSCDLSSSEDEDSLVTQSIKARLAEARLKASQSHRAYLAVKEDTSILDDQTLSQGVNTWLATPKQPVQLIVTV
ncbi:uncharacterized protein FA14DRAFT_161740 [Meira miltonrushii]|uniref:Uncharacterized protein n=1 Tax=Meira miltonrushii TaxID=1280837 RepID=A0A316VB25_9BASI|nr:uncharacterized protein FA14DRAFT_161740 [Meira miltonrushii]PWN34298.1 hypothetical protein FA14DRAFT_161740 [Meira miltonrushii]